MVEEIIYLLCFCVLLRTLLTPPFLSVVSQYNSWLPPITGNLGASELNCELFIPPLLEVRLLLWLGPLIDEGPEVLTYKLLLLS